MKDWKKLSKVLIPLSLMSLSSAFADNGNGCCPPVNNCCPVDCCKPCCVPQPRKCIDCECYVPQYYNLQCACGFFVSADFLWWYGHETNLQFAERVVATTDVPFLDFVTMQPVRHETFGTKWAPGVRVGVGWNTDCDGWDLYLNWTGYWNDKHDTEKAFFTGLFPKIGEQALLVDWDTVSVFDFAFFERVKAKWDLHFNQIDLELGRKFWLSRCTALRPYIGIRGAWTKVDFDIRAISGPKTFITAPTGSSTAPIPGIESTDFKASINDFTNKYWGVGLLGGIQPEFHLGDWCGCGDFIIFGNFEGALIYGRERRSRFGHTLEERGGEVFGNVTFRDKGSEYRLQGILDLALGIRWESRWCCDRYMTSIDLAWENHLWFDFSTRYYNTNSFTVTPGFNSPACACPGIVNVVNETIPDNASVGTYRTSLSRVSDLGLGGLVIRLRFDF